MTKIAYDKRCRNVLCRLNLRYFTWVQPRRYRSTDGPLRPVLLTNSVSQKLKNAMSALPFCW